MQTPEELKKFLALDGGEERLALVQSLVTPEKKGVLVTVTSLADEEIGKFLDRYHAHANHAADPDGKLRKGATLDSKIKALGKVVPKLDPTPANYQRHLQFLGTLRLMRNKAAHQSGLSLADATKLAKNPEALAIIKDYPDGLWAKVRALIKYLEALPL